jgi:GT2 family glycosyltransferase
VIEISFCVVNTQQRELLLRGLDAIARERSELPFDTEVLVLDNASRDGSAGAARAHPAVDDVIALEQRTGKAENDSTLLRRARGRYALLLNEDSELLPGAAGALHAALAGDERAAAAGAALLRPDGTEQPSAWRLPGPGTALAQALLLHRWLVVQSRGGRTRPVGWCQSAALLVRRDAATEVGEMDPAFFVYGDETDFEKRLTDAGWRILWVPQARAIHHEQLSTGGAWERRVVEFARNRDRYMRKHHGSIVALACRPLHALPYALRAVGALVLPGHDARRYAAHVAAALLPGRGEGIREAASREPSTG